MEIRDYLKDELKRLNRRNDLLEKETNKTTIIRLDTDEQIKNNALTMCEIAKTLKELIKETSVAGTTDALMKMKSTLEDCE